MQQSFATLCYVLVLYTATRMLCQAQVQELHDLEFSETHKMYKDELQCLAISLESISHSVLGHKDFVQPLWVLVLFVQAQGKRACAYI